jgi:hypothetical protein
MDTDFTRKKAQGSRQDAQEEVAADQICGALPKGFNPKTYVTRPWKITSYIHDGYRIDLGGRTLEVLATPGHTATLHGRHLLSRDHLALPPRDRLRRLRRLDPSPGRARPANQDGPRRTQHPGRVALSAPAFGGRL